MANEATLIDTAGAAPVADAAGAAAAGAASADAGAGAAAGDAAADGKQADGTLLDDKAAGDGKASHPADWPEDWKERGASGDKKVAGWIKKYGSVNAALKAGAEADSKIRSGEYKRPVAEDASPEEKAAWRKENGIPEKADEYVKAVTLGDFVPGEAEKPIISEIASVAHELDISPDKTSKLMQKYFAIQEKAAADVARMDSQNQQDGIVELRTELGSEFRPMIQTITNFLEARPALKSALYARGADGRIIGSNPAIMRELATLANEENPTAGLVPTGTKDIGKAVTDRIAELNQIYVNDPDRYVKENLQAEQTRLIVARDKAASR